MKPLRFDMTQVANALKASTPAERIHADTPARVEEQPLAVFPQDYIKGSSWVANMAHEQIHALATHILARHGDLGMRTLAITSALAGEGKTTVTLALAERLATADKSILIIDLDIHRGTLSQSAQLDQQPGALESSAADRGGPTFHAFQSDMPGVTIMPCGQAAVDEMGVALLSPDRIQRLVARSLDKFDIILLDCPPLTPVADTHIIGEVADASILVVRAGSTPKDVLEQSLTQYGKDKFFAAVLNRARPHEIPYFRDVYGYYRREPYVRKGKGKGKGRNKKN